MGTVYSNQSIPTQSRVDELDFEGNLEFTNLTGNLVYVSCYSNE